MKKMSSRRVEELLQLAATNPAHGPELLRALVGGYTVGRHGKHGEIPDFKWYKKNFKKLYPYNRKLPTSETSDE